jgi:hypothetical protein
VYSEEAMDIQRLFVKMTTKDEHIKYASIFDLIRVGIPLDNVGNKLNVIKDELYIEHQGQMTKLAFKLN